MKIVCFCLWKKRSQGQKKSVYLSIILDPEEYREFLNSLAKNSGQTLFIIVIYNLFLLYYVKCMYGGKYNLSKIEL